MELALPSDRFARGGADDALTALVRRAQAGDTAAFRALFIRYHDRVYRYVALRLGGVEEAGDVVQDVFLAVWRGLPSFRIRHEGSFPAWMFRIARNLAAESLRRDGRRRTVGLDAWPEGGVEFEGSLVSQRALIESLRELPESQREVVVLRFVAGLSARDVAGAIGRTESAVTALQVRALRRLRRRIEEIEGAT